MLTVSAQHDLLTKDFTFEIGEEHTMWTRISGKGTRQYYVNDEGQAVFHGDVILSGANIDNASVGDKSNYAKETLTLALNGKLHYNEGMLDGPFSVNYKYSNTADSKQTSAYGRVHKEHGKLQVNYSISGGFEMGYATGTWQVSCETTETTNRTTTKRYSVTAKYERGKLVSYVKNDNGNKITLDQAGNVSGIFEDRNIYHGLELPTSGSIRDDLAALMERGQWDSAIWKGIDYYYHFYHRSGNYVGYSRTFNYEVLNSTMEGLFVILGGIEDPIAQFKGKTYYYVYEEDDDKPYFTYSQVKEYMNEKLNSEYRSNCIRQLYHAIHVSRELTINYNEGYITSSVAARLQPTVDSLMKGVVLNDLAENFSSRLKKALSEYENVESYKKGGSKFRDTLYDRTGIFWEFNMRDDKIEFIDSANFCHIALPCTFSYPNKQYEDLPETYLMGFVLTVDLSKRLDRLCWYPNEPVGTSFSTTELVKIPTLWDTIVPLYREWDSLMAIAKRYDGHTPDFNKQMNFSDKDKKLKALEKAKENYSFLKRWLPKVRLFCAVQPTDHEAYLLLKEIERKDNLIPAMSDCINGTNVYADATSEEEILAQGNSLKQFYSDLLMYLNLEKQRVPNHNSIIEKRKNAKYIVDLYTEYYETFTPEWDKNHTALPTLKKLVEYQQKIIKMLDRSDIEDINKQAKKSKKTLDEIMAE